MKDHFEIKQENQTLRATLEARSPGCTAKISDESKRDGATTEQLFAENDALIAVQSAIASAAAVATRGAAVAAKYLPPQSATATTGLSPSAQRIEDKIKSAGGIKQFGLKSEIARLTELFTSARGKTREAMSLKISKANTELKRLGAIVATLFMLGLTANAELLTVGNLTGGTNTIAASAGRTNYIAVDGFPDAVQIGFTGRYMQEAATGNLLVVTRRSIDSTTYETARRTNVVSALSGTNFITGILRLGTNDAYLPTGVLSIEILNTNASATVTNLKAVLRANSPARSFRYN